MSSLDGHLGCHLLAVGNIVAMNMGVQVSVWVPAFNSFGYLYPRSKIAGSSGNCNFWRSSQTVLHSNDTILHSHQGCTRFQFLHIPANTFYFLTSFTMACDDSVPYKVFSSQISSASPLLPLFLMCFCFSENRLRLKTFPLY